MKRGLKRNICNLESSIPLSEVKDLPSRRTDYIGDTLRYACRYWTTHLANTSNSNLDVEEVQKAINDFFTTQFLFWVEVLSLTGNLEVGVYALDDIQQWYTSVS